jgi:hypothetical protein
MLRDDKINAIDSVTNTTEEFIETLIVNWGWRHLSLGGVIKDTCNTGRLTQTVNAQVYYSIEIKVEIKVYDRALYRATASALTG